MPEAFHRFHRYFSAAALMAILGLFSCNNKQCERYYDPTILVDSNNVPLDSNQYYFPVEEMPIVTDATEFDSIENVIYLKSKTLYGTVDTSNLEYYSHFLYKMNEPLLFNKNLEKDVFRFIWVRSLSYPVVFRIEKTDENVILYWKVTDGREIYETGNIIRSGCKELSKTDWCVFKKYYGYRFWERESFFQVELDGSTWLMEGAADGKYHVVYTFYPRGTPIYKMGLFLIRLSDIGQYKCNVY